MQERAAAAFDIGYGQACFFTDPDHFFQVHAFGTVMEKSRYFRFFHIRPVAHGQGSRGISHTQGMYEPFVMQLCFKISDQRSSV
jgi:hypothetical protein